MRVLSVNSASIVRNFLGKGERLKLLGAEHPYFTTTETSRSAIEAHRTTIYKNDNLNNICARQHCACQRGLSIENNLNKFRSNQLSRATREYLNQQHQQLVSTTFRGPTPSAARKTKHSVNRYINPPPQKKKYP